MAKAAAAEAGDAACIGVEATACQRTTVSMAGSSIRLVIGASGRGREPMDSVHRAHRYRSTRDLVRAIRIAGPIVYQEWHDGYPMASSAILAVKDESSI